MHVLRPLLLRREKEACHEIKATLATAWLLVKNLKATLEVVPRDV